MLFKLRDLVKVKEHVTDCWVELEYFRDQVGEISGYGYDDDQPAYIVRFCGNDWYFFEDELELA